MSLQEVEKVWGAPVMVQETGSGMVKRFYKIKTPGDVGFEFRYFVVKDGMVVFSGISDTLDMATN